MPAELVQSLLGRLDAAEELYRQALDMQRELLGEDHVETAGTLANLGQVLVQQGRLDEAEEVFGRSLGATRRALGDRHGRTGVVLASLANVAQARGDLETAERRYGEAVDVLRAAGETAHLAGALHNLASLLRDAGRLEDARRCFREALDLNAAHLGDDHPEVAMIKTSLSLVEGALGANAEAETLARQAVAVLDHSFPADSPWTAAARRALGSSLSAQERYDEAEPFLTGDLEWLRRNRGADAPATRHAVDRLIALYDAWGRQRESAEYRRLAAEMDETEDGS